VLVLDEATSALDNETERQLVENMNINGHSLTTIIVAHRLSSLKYCDVIIELTNGKVSNFGNYENVVGG
jgi:ATP-binding cassette subfamily B protein